MKNSNDKQLCDIVIGEAVIELFTEDTAVSHASLIAQLEKKIQAGGTPESVCVTLLALDEVKRSSLSHEEQPDDGVINVLAKSVVSDDNTQH